MGSGSKSHAQTAGNMLPQRWLGGRGIGGEIEVSGKADCYSTDVSIMATINCNLQLMGHRCPISSSRAWQS